MISVQTLRWRALRVVAQALAASLLVPSHALSQSAGPQPSLVDRSLEDLLNIEVTSVSKKAEALSRAAAAVFVISQQDIRRSGATNIPDLLRMAPGVNVARIDANTYAISIRGLNDRLADKVLVLVDGRTVYTPTTSGVYWDQVDVPLEDIDRIEVIRGPGGTMWGANAVNGVINIITKTTSETKGALVRMDGGAPGSAGALVQYGGSAGHVGAYRVFTNYSNVGNQTASDGVTPASDGYHFFHSGFRSDWNLSRYDNLTVQGDLMQTREGQNISVVLANALPAMATFNEALSVGEGNLVGRWDHKLANGSDTSLQIYFDRYRRFDEGVHETLNTVDFDFQHHLLLGSRHDVVWGAGYRFTSDSHLPGYGKTYFPLNLENNLYSAFAQDEIRITDSLSATIGSKVERQPYSGFDYEPSVRLVWEPTARQTWWVSGAQAIKQVSREQTGLIIDPYTFPLSGGGFGVAQIIGNPGGRPERLRDAEMGYRVRLGQRLSMDLTTFSSHYHGLQTLEPQAPYFTTDQGPPHFVLPMIFENSASAHTFGAELSTNWNVTRWWRISSGYSFIHLNILPAQGSQDTHQNELAANTPENQFQVRSWVDLPRNFEWDTTAYCVGSLREGGDGPVPGYSRVDTRIGWRPTPSIEISVGAQNLFTPRHAEFHNAYEVRRTLVNRGGVARITWRF